MQSSPELIEEISALFRKNPFIIDTADGIGRRIGRTASQVEPALNYLIDKGILCVRVAGKIRLVFLDRTRLSQLPVGPQESGA